MPKAIRKNFFNWSPEEFEKVLIRLLENMQLRDVRMHSAAQVASAAAVERFEYAGHTIDVKLATDVKWIGQSTGVSVFLRVEETQHEWSACLCNRFADCLLGTVKTICELDRGIDD